MYALRTRPAIGRCWNPPESLLRRSRWAISALVACLLLALGYAQAWEGSAASPARPEAAYETVSVGDGETLWAIATRRYPGEDPRVKIAQIEQLNGLSGPTILAGQRLKVPVG